MSTYDGLHGHDTGTKAVEKARTVTDRVQAELGRAPRAYAGRPAPASAPRRRAELTPDQIA
jgi:hypothetical protein